MAWKAIVDRHNSCNVAVEVLKQICTLASWQGRYHENNENNRQYGISQVQYLVKPFLPCQQPVLLMAD